MVPGVSGSAFPVSRWHSWSLDQTRAGLWGGHSSQAATCKLLSGGVSCPVVLFCDTSSCNSSGVHHSYKDGDVPGLPFLTCQFEHIHEEKLRLLVCPPLGQKAVSGRPCKY